MADLYDKNGTKFSQPRTLSKNDVLRIAMEIGHTDQESILIDDSEDRSMSYDETNLQKKILGDKLGFFGDKTGTKDFPVDEASREGHSEILFTGGTIQYAASGEVDKIEYDNTDPNKPDYELTNPIRMGKWEYWNLDVAAALKVSLNRGDILPDDCGKDDALFVGFGRNSTPLNLTKTELVNNAGVFTHSTCIDKDEDLVTESNRIIDKFDIGTKIRSVKNWGLEPPTTESPGWDIVKDKKYDIIIAATPPFDKRTGNYWVKSQIRGAEKGIEAGKDLTGAPELPFKLKTELYTKVAKFEDRCFDDNWGELNTVFRNAKSLLKPGGYILTVHNTYASDIDTFKPMIDKFNLTLVQDGLLTRQAHDWPLARHFYMRQTLVGPLYPSNKYYMLCKV